MNRVSRIKTLRDQCIEDLKNCTDSKELVWVLKYYHKRIRFQNAILKVLEKTEQVWYKIITAASLK